MLTPIIERILDYKKIISKYISTHSKTLINFLVRFNIIITLVLKKIKYKFDIRFQYYQLGKYLSKNDNQKYDFSNDKMVIDMLERIRMVNNKIAESNRDLETTLDD